MAIEAQDLARTSSCTEHVVLLDALGRATGTEPKATAHRADTPFHLAFSCHLVAADGSLLLTRRAGTKRTWPGVWSNGCCGHPQVGETLRDAVARRVEEELGLAIRRLALALPDFAYRSTMTDGTVEHELCPVLFATVDGTLRPDLNEVDGTEWTTWAELVERAALHPTSLSPWCVAQVARLVELKRTPAVWLDDPAAVAALGLDRPVGVVGPPPPASPRPRAAVDPLDHVARRVRQVLDPFLEGRRADLLGLHPALAEVASSISELVDAGGKRLRPAFVYWGHLAAGGTEDGVVQVAGAVELLHTFALLHDDVMDRSQHRRGLPAAHRRFAATHREQLDLGDSDWFGYSAAILAGDLAHVWADELFESAPVERDALDRARVVYNHLRTEVIAGQYLDLRLAAAAAAQPDDARLVALLKSARYTVTRPLLLGAALAGHLAHPALLRSLSAYGDAVGLAFQLRDDVLGLFGDPGLTGKSDLDDLREGKRTMLVLRALQLADEADRRLITGALGDPSVDEERADAVRAAVARTGAQASIEALLASLHDSAATAVAAITEPSRTALLELADLAIDRTS